MTQRIQLPANEVGKHRQPYSEMTRAKKKKPYDKPDTGVLFRNMYKHQDNHPDFTGHYICQDGVKRQVAGWTNGDRISLRFTDLYVKEQEAGF